MRLAKSVGFGIVSGGVLVHHRSALCIWVRLAETRRWRQLGCGLLLHSLSIFLHIWYRVHLRILLEGEETAPKLKLTHYLISIAIYVELAGQPPCHYRCGKAISRGAGRRNLR
jgi:hypothetical protein